VFCAVLAVQEGLDNLMSQEEANRSLIVFQANKFCPFTSNLPQDYERKIKELPGVEEVVPIQVFTNNCRASLDIVVFYGLPARQLRGSRDFRLLQGSWEEFERNQDSAVVGQAVAKRRGLSPGDPFTIGGLKVNVVGVYASNNPAEENYVYAHLPFLQQQKQKNLYGTVTQLEIKLASTADADQVSTAIDNLFRGGPVQTDTRTKGAFQRDSLADLMDLIHLSKYLGFACVGLVLALVATTTFMAVQDRVGEHAVLQTIGFSGAKIFGLVLSETLLVSFLGGALGVGCALVALTFGDLAIGAEAVTIALVPTLDLALIGLGVALVTGLIAGLIPAWQAARAEIVPALRQM
jgi:putative ABC transport system permease protein